MWSFSLPNYVKWETVDWYSQKPVVLPILPVREGRISTYAVAMFYLKQWFKLFSTKEQSSRRQFSKDGALERGKVRSGWFKRECNLDLSYVPFTVGFMLLWGSNATTDLIGGRAQATSWVIKNSCKNKWSFADLPSAHFQTKMFIGQIMRHSKKQESMDPVLWREKMKQQMLPENVTRQ